MTRRQLLALGILAPAAHAAAVNYRNNPPYFPYLDLIESGHDEYPADPPMPRHPAPRDGRFADITGAVLSAPQLEKGIPYWISHLDPPPASTSTATTVSLSAISTMTVATKSTSASPPACPTASTAG